MQRVTLTLCSVALIAQTSGAASNEWRQLSRTNLLEFVSESRVVPVRSIEDWQRRRESIKAAMQEVMGPLPGVEKRCALEVRVEEQTVLGDYVRQFISYAAEPNERVSAYLLLPAGALTARREFPAVLALHQTHPLGQKVVVGLSNSTNDEYGVGLVKRGFVVLAPRNVFINAPLGDTNFKWQSVDAVCEQASKIYGLYGASDRLIVEHPDCEHRFPKEMQERAFELMEQVLKR